MSHNLEVPKFLFPPPPQPPKKQRHILKSKKTIEMGRIRECVELSSEEHAQPIFIVPLRPLCAPTKC